MKLREFGVYVVIIILLVLGIFLLLRSSSKNITNNVFDARQSPTKVMDKTQGRQTDTIVNGVKKQMKNYWGVVEEWNGVTGKLTLNQDGKTIDYQIDSELTTVEIVRSQNKFNDKRLYIINKSAQPMHWQQAFCKGDTVTMLVDPTSAKVKWIMNTGYRACGFKEELK